METDSTELPDQQRRATALLAVVLLLSVALRGWHLANHLHGPLGNSEILLSSSDMAAFNKWARLIANGDWLSTAHFHPYMDWMENMGTLAEFEAWWGGKEIFHQNPLYPYVLALIYCVFGSAVPMLVLQILMSTAGALLVFLLTRRFADAWSGLAAATLAAFFAPSIVFDGFLLRVSMNSFLTLLSLWLLIRLHDRPSFRLGGLVGGVLAASFLLRPTGLLLLASAPLLPLLFPRMRHAWRQWLPALAIGAVLVIAPFVVRNVLVGAPAFQFSTRGPETVIQSHTCGVDPGFMTLPEKDVFRSAMERSGTSLLGAIGTAIESWPHNSMSAWLAHQGQKVICVFRDFEYLNNVNFYYHRETTPVLRWLPTFGWFVGLGFAGILLLAFRGRDRRLLALPWIAGAALLIGSTLGFALGRYRLPLAILMTIPAGVAVATTIRFALSRRIGLALGIVAGAATLSTLSFTVEPVRSFYDGDQALPVSPHYRGMYESMKRLRAWEYLEAAKELAVRGEKQRAVAELKDYVAANSAIRDRYAPALRRLPMATEYLYLQSTFVARCERVANELRRLGAQQQANAIVRAMAPIQREIRAIRGR